MYVVSSVVFLLPRGIALCYVNSKIKVPYQQNMMYQWNIMGWLKLKDIPNDRFIW